ncbi:zinc metallopeptidase [Aurantivibrio plasticivorans]
MLASIVFLAIYTPSLWVRYVMRKHASTIDDMPGNGGELTEHLIQRFGLVDVVVEDGGEASDHFDPAASAVRLSSEHYHGKSLRAVAIAAHEVGRAIQFQRRERLIVFCDKVWSFLHKFEKGSAIFLMLFPALGAAERIPSIFIISITSQRFAKY